MNDRRTQLGASFPESLFFVLVGATLGILSEPALAQAYPSRLVRIVVAFSPGGVPDILARVLARELQTRLGPPVVVDNRQGGGGLIGSDAVAKAPADGYTLLLGSTGPQAIAPALYAKFPYDPRKDLTPVSLVAKSGNVLLVNYALPAKNVKQLIALAKARPGAMNYASAGVGSSNHLSSAMLNQMARINVGHVPYKGDAQALPDVAAGQIEMMFASVPLAMSFAKSGKVIMLAVTTPRRLKPLPEVPTIAESGLPNYDFSTWYGVFVTGGTDSAIVELLARETKRAFDIPEVKTQLIGLGVEAAPGSPAEFRKQVDDDLDKFAKAAKSMAISLE
jgi:tripartite-type tricarboxylate transporter receptor subunit TctC